MPKFNEQSLEEAIVALFEEAGYIHTKGDEVHKELSEVLLTDDLRAYLKARYSSESITPTEVESAIAAISADRGSTLYEKNASTFRLLTEGFELKREDSTLTNLLIEPIDFSQPTGNLLRIVNQLEIKGIEEKRIPDGIVYVNGLPMVVLEFKSAVREDAMIKDAFNQLTIRYRRDIPELFKYNAFVVISDGVNNKYGSLFSPYEDFYAWRKAEVDDEETDGIPSLLTMVQGIFRPDRLMAVISDFVFFPDTSTKLQKVVCRYPQFFATQRLFSNICQHSKMREDGDGKGGTYFGTTGCGKSFTMLFLTRKLMRSLEFASPSIVLITDRTDLDMQLTELFVAAKQFIGDNCVEQVQNRADLREKLSGRQSGGVFLTTIQKFTEDIQLLSDRTNIVCISDEAHRSQTNLKQRVTITKEGVQRGYGFAKYLHDSLPNATYVGFTGTPIDATIEVFGPVVDSYTMMESVADGITSPIIYEGRAAKVLLDNSKLKEIEDYYKQCAEEGANENQIEESKRAVAKMEAILGDPDRLRAVAEDFVAHYEKRIEEGATVKGKAMFVCSNRTIAYNLYKEIVTLRPEWAKLPEARKREHAIEPISYDMAAEPEMHYSEPPMPLERIKLVMTRNKDDEPALYDMLGTSDYRALLSTQFKNAYSNFKIAIVVDMWITGFDVPCLDTMYIDKPVQKHTLIQTISRVNRIYPGKTMGLVVDYIGIKRNLDKAISEYSGAKRFDGESVTPLDTTDAMVTIVKDELDILRRMFHTFDYSLFLKGKPLEQLDCLNRAAESVQETDEKETTFMSHSKKMKAAYNLCASSDEFTGKDRNDIDFFCAVRSVLYKLTKGNAPDAAQMNQRVAKMLQEALHSESVEAIVKVGNDSAKMDLLSKEQMERISKIELPNTKVKLMERLLRTVIGDFKKVNKIKGIDFSKRLEKLVKQYNERDLAYASKVIEEVAKKMAELLEDVNKERASFKELGITYEEKAFYDILKTIAIQFDFEFPEEKLLALASEIKTLVDDKSKYTDWSNRVDIKAELKVDLILTLEKYGYPPVTNDAVYKEIFEQAENFKKYND